MNKRPIITKEMEKEACLQVGKKLELGYPEILAKHYQWPENGLDIAHELNAKEGWSWGIELSEDFADSLDEISNIVEKEHKKEVEKWFIDNNIQQPYPLGTKVRYRSMNQDCIGYLQDIDTMLSGRYIIKDEKEPIEGPKSRAIINFEDVEKID